MSHISSTATFFTLTFCLKLTFENYRFFPTSWHFPFFLCNILHTKRKEPSNLWQRMWVAWPLTFGLTTPRTDNCYFWLWARGPALMTAYRRQFIPTAHTDELALSIFWENKSPPNIDFSTSVPTTRASLRLFFSRVILPSKISKNFNNFNFFKNLIRLRCAWQTTRDNPIVVKDFLEDEGFCLVDKVRSFSGLLALS